MHGYRTQSCVMHPVLGLQRSTLLPWSVSYAYSDTVGVELRTPPRWRVL